MPLLKKFASLSIGRSFGLVAILAAVIAVVSVAVTLNQARIDLVELKRSEVKEIVEAAASTVNAYLARVEKGELKEADAQKLAIAEIDSEINAKIAEKKIFLDGELAKADPAGQDQIRRQLASELARLEEKREREKEKVRSGAA